MKKVLLILALLFVLEKLLLRFILDPYVAQDFDSYADFVERMYDQDGGLRAIEGIGCVNYRLIVIYSYRICAHSLGYGSGNGGDRFVVLLERPAGYITLIPWRDAGRLDFDSIVLGNMNVDGSYSIRGVE